MPPLLIVLLLLVAPVSTQAQAAPGEDEALAASGGFFAVSVADLASAERWYVEKLGLTRVAGGGRMERLNGYAVLEGHGWTVELIGHDDSIRPEVATPEMVQGFVKAGVIVNDFEAAVAALRARGVEIPMGPFPARETMRANLVFRDVEGNLIQLLGGYARD